jgi:hypothetical protein
MNCPKCGKPLVIEKITHQILVVAESVIGVTEISELEYEASEVLDTIQERILYFRCCSCFSDLRMTEQEVIKLINADPKYGTVMIA